MTLHYYLRSTNVSLTENRNNESILTLPHTHTTHEYEHVHMNERTEWEDTVNRNESGRGYAVHIYQAMKNDFNAVCIVAT